jgi:uncharacterized RDD family membrane protein YckC
LGTPATFVPRLVAYFIDAFVAAALYIPGYALFFIGAAIGGGFGAIFVLLGVLLLIAGFVAAIYIFIVGQGQTGQTPGKRMQGIKLVKSGSGSGAGHPIGAVNVFIRAFLANILVYICFIGYLWMFFDSEKKTLYDKILDNAVVQVEKGELMPIFPSGKPF